MTRGQGKQSRTPWPFRVALLAFPRSMRRRCGEDLVEAARDSCDPATSSGTVSVRPGVVRTCVDILGAGLRARIDMMHGWPRVVVDLLESLASDTRHALRSLRKTPAFTLAALTTLALGIGANTAIFSVVDAVLLRPLPFPEPDRLVTVWDSHERRGVARWGVSYHDFEDWRDRNEVFDAIAVYNTRNGNMNAGEHAVRATYTMTTPDFFAALAVEPASGRSFAPEENDPGRDGVAVISDALWRGALAGSADVLGSTIVIDDQPLAVIGVMPPGFDFPSGTDVWKPFGMRPDDAGQRDSYWVSSIARLRPGVSVQQAEADVDRIMAALAVEYPESNADIGGYVEPLLQTWVGGSRSTLMLVWGTAALVLLIVCVNVASLLMTRATVRESEIALRAALGAGRARLVRQLLTESVVLAVLGGAAGMLVAWQGTRLIVQLDAGAIPRLEGLGVNAIALAFTGALSVLTGIGFGLAPAIRAGRADVRAGLGAGARETGSGRRFGARGALVIAELALAVAVLVGAGLLIRSFAVVLDRDPGFDPDNVLTMRVEPPMAVGAADYGSRAEFKSAFVAERAEAGAFYERLLARTRSLPGVLGAAVTNNLPLAGNRWGARLSIDGRPLSEDDVAPTALTRAVGVGYFRTMRIDLLSGRDFADSDTADSQFVVVVNRELASRYFDGDDPVGSRFTMMDPDDDDAIWYTIVGVVEDVPHMSLDVLSRPIVYTPLPQSFFGFFGDWGMNLVVRTEGDPLGYVEAIRRETDALGAGLPLFDVRTMQQRLDDRLAGRRFVLALIALFGAVAVTLAAVGVYGVMSYATAQRTRETGLRLALGARPREIRRLVLTDGLILAGCGVAVGVGGALALSSLLETLLFGVTARDTVTFVVVPLVMLAIAGLASGVPAIRQSRVDPAVALRADT